MEAKWRVSLVCSLRGSGLCWILSLINLPLTSDILRVGWRPSNSRAWGWELVGLGHVACPQGWAIRDLSSRLAARFLGHGEVLTVLFSFWISVPSRDLYSPVVPSFRREPLFCHWDGSECLRISLRSPTVPQGFGFWNTGAFVSMGFLTVFPSHLQILVIKSPDSLRCPTPPPPVCMFNPQFLVVGNPGRLRGCFMNIPSSFFHSPKSRVFLLFLSDLLPSHCSLKVTALHWRGGHTCPGKSLSQFSFHVPACDTTPMPLVKTYGKMLAFECILALWWGSL